MAETTKASAPSSPRSVWEFNLTGSREGVLKDVKTIKTRPADADQRQLDSAKEFIADEISELHPQFKGVKVIASGELDANAGRNVTHIEIYGLNNLSL